MKYIIIILLSVGCSTTQPEPIQTNCNRPFDWIGTWRHQDTVNNPTFKLITCSTGLYRINHYDYPMTYEINSTNTMSYITMGRATKTFYQIIDNNTFDFEYDSTKRYKRIR